MKFKKILAITLSALTITSVSSAISTTAFADNGDITVVYNNDEIEFENAKPSIVNSRTLVPLRGVFDAMGYEISYDATTKTATLTKGTTVVTASTNKMTVTTNGTTSNIIGDVSPQIIDNYFMIPLRSVAGATGAEIDWNADTRTVSIVLAPNTVVKEDPIGRMSVDEQEYIQQIKDTTLAITKFAINNKDKVLLTALGRNSYDEVTTGGDESHYKTVYDSLNKLKSMDAPDAMSEVQELVESYVNTLTSLISTATSGASNEDLKAKAEETSKTLSSINADFGVKLYNYFINNSVNFEAVYGDTVLDALK